MGFLDRMFGKPFEKDDKVVTTQKTYGNAPTSINTLFSGNRVITEEQILSIPAAENAIELITSSIAQLSVNLYVNADDDNKRERITDDQRLNLLNYKVNSNLDSFNFKKKIVRDILIYGTHKGYIEYDEDDHVKAIYPFNMPDLTIEVKTMDGISYFGEDILMSPAGTKTFRDDYLFSVLRDSSDGITGRSPIQEADDVFKTSLAQTDYERGLMENSAMPSGYLSTEAKLDDNSLTRIAKAWKFAYSGAKNAGKTAILEQGLKYTPTQFDPKNLEFSDGKKSMISEIARLFNIPEPMINSSAQKYNSLEQNNLYFLKFTLMPLINSVELSLNTSLLTQEERDQGYRFIFDTSNFTQVTSKDLTDTVIQAYKSGLITNEQAKRKLGYAVTEDEVEYLSGSIGTIFIDPVAGTVTNPNTGVAISIKDPVIANPGEGIGGPDDLQATLNAQDDSEQQDDEKSTSESEDESETDDETKTNEKVDKEDE